jgi:hypothetical protein
MGNGHFIYSDNVACGEGPVHLVLWREHTVPSFPAFLHKELLKREETVWLYWTTRITLVDLYTKMRPVQCMRPRLSLFDKKRSI